VKQKKSFTVGLIISLVTLFCVYFFMRPPEMTTATLAIFVHIPKTAGEGFKRNIEASYSRNHFIRTSFTHFEPYYDIGQKKVKFYEGLNHFKTNIASLLEQDRKAIRCIAGHDSYFGIHELFPQEPKYITFIRDPIDRTISLYNFERTAWEIYSTHLPFNPFEHNFLKRLQDHFLIDGKVPDFETWLEQIYNQKHPFYLSMANYLTHLGFSTDSLDQFAFVGITESYDEDALFLYHELGVSRFYADKNASTHFVIREQLEDRVLEKIKEKNQEDFRLYQLALEKNQELKNQREDFQQIISSMQKKKTLFLILEPALGWIERIIHKCQKIFREIN